MKVEAILRSFQPPLSRTTCVFPCECPSNPQHRDVNESSEHRCRLKAERALTDRIIIPVVSELATAAIVELGRIHIALSQLNVNGSTPFALTNSETVVILVRDIGRAQRKGRAESARAVHGCQSQRVVVRAEAASGNIQDAEFLAYDIGLDDAGVVAVARGCVAEWVRVSANVGALGGVVPVDFLAAGLGDCHPEVVGCAGLVQSGDHGGVLASAIPDFGLAGRGGVELSQCCDELAVPSYNGDALPITAVVVNVHCPGLCADQGGGCKGHDGG